jgi:hypothetical protein
MVKQWWTDIGLSGRAIVITLLALATYLFLRS